MLDLLPAAIQSYPGPSPSKPFSKEDKSECSLSCAVSCQELRLYNLCLINWDHSVPPPPPPPFPAKSFST